MAKKDRNEIGDEGSQAAELVRIALKNGEVFMAPDGQAYIRWTVGGRQEVWALGQRRFKEALSAWYMKHRKRVPNSGALNDAISVLSGLAAQAEGPFAVQTRVGEANGRIYVDLCNTERDLVAVSAGSWRLLKRSPVRFRRARGMLALPRPERGGSIRSLRGYLNVATEHDFILVVGWLLASLRPRGPFPVLVLCGEAGSAKSTSTRVLRTLVDPNEAPIRSAPHEVRDLMVAAANGRMVVFDNISRLPPWISDALCRLATGGGFSKRENYTDMEEVLINVQRPVILNGIDEMVTRGDLMDRSIVLNLPRICEQDRRTEDEFWREFEAEQPKILGALLDGVARALRDIDSTTLPAPPRMADFATWAFAGLPGVGLDSQAFLEAHGLNLTTASQTVLDASPVGRYLQAFAEGEGFRGPAHELLDKLNKEASDGDRRHWGWPRSPLQLANSLRRLAPVLARIGVVVRTGNREGKTGERIITIRTTERAAYDD